MTVTPALFCEWRDLSRGPLCIAVRELNRRLVRIRPDEHLARSPYAVNVPGHMRCVAPEQEMAVRPLHVGPSGFMPRQLLEGEARRIP